MTAWFPALRWFVLRALLLLATLLASGCGYATYNIPPAELQRLSQLPPSQRGNHVRVYTPGLVPAATPEAQVAAAPPALPAALPPAPPSVPPPLPDAGAGSEPIDPLIPPEVVDLSDSQSDPLSPPAFVSVNIAPPMPMHAPRPPLHVLPAPARPLAVGRPSVPRPSFGHIPAPRAFPVHGAAPAVHGVGGHPHVGGGLHHSGGGGGGGGAAVGALVGAVVLVGLMVAIAEASQPTPFDGWIRTSPERALQLVYQSGSTREVRLCDLKPADTIGVRSASLDDMDGSVQRLESATSSPPTTQPPRLTSPPVPAPPLAPAVTSPQRPPAPRFTSSRDPFS
jgi:hypothetical protein